MRTGHLFAGAGGGLYADLILGHEPVLAVEWDDHAAACLQQREREGWWPGLHVHQGDVQLFDFTPWAGRVDSIHAGWPCQDISVAGNGAGIDGERSGLWREVKRAATEARPGELFLENSPAIVNNGLDRVAADLSELGYVYRWCLLPAASVGAVHLRLRWWCLARRADANRDRFQRFDPCSSPATAQQEEWSDVARVAREIQRGERDRVPESWIVGKANAVADRKHRTRCLGNGQVPLQAATAYILLDAGLGT